LAELRHFSMLSMARYAAPNEMNESPSESAHPATRVNYRAWFWRVLAWDGLLPLVVWIAPFVIKAVVPNREEPLMLVTVLTAIGVFLLRWMVGVKPCGRCKPSASSLDWL
jgi:hypothetical protein